jgi:hypothetical protein
MSFPYFDEVQRAHQELLAEGKIKTRATQEEVEQDKGLLTRRSGWYSYERDPSIGLMEKLEGNNSLGYSVDCVLSKVDGTSYDIATDSAGLAQPVNGGPSAPYPADIPRWREPTKELAQLEESTPGPTPQPPDNSEIVSAIVAEILNAIAASEAAIMAHDDANTQKILDMITSIKDQVEESLQKALVLILAKRRRNPDEPVP